MKFRKIVLLTLILSFLLSFSACKKTSDTSVALTVGNASVDSAIFTYYLDTQISATGEADKSDSIEKAEELCAHYIYVNTEFQKRELKLTSNEKDNLASDVEDIWNLYGLYYSDIGITKADVTKIKTSEAYEAALINSIYGSGGENEISEEELKTYFSENYIFFKVINAYLTGDEEEDEATKDTFESLKKKIKDDTTIDDVNAEYVESIGGSASDTLEVSFMKKGTDTYPESFFTDVAALETDDTKLLTYDNYIFLVSKCDNDDYFSDYKTTILSNLSSETLSNYLKESYDDKTVSGVSSVENDCFSTIKDIKTK